MFRSTCVVRAAASALRRDEPADLLRFRKNHVGAITHHAGRYEGRSFLLRTILAAVRLETKIPLPIDMRLAICRADPVGIGAIGDRLHPAFGIERLEIGDL